MTIDLGLLALVLASGGFVALSLWRKIPLLLQVPQPLIDESFVTRPSTIKRFLKPVRDFYRERKWRDLYFTFLVAALRAVRVWLLRSERLTVQALERLEEQSRRWSEEKVAFWSELKQWKQESREAGGAPIPQAVFNPEPPPAMTLELAPAKKRRPRRQKVMAVEESAADTTTTLV